MSSITFTYDLEDGRASPSDAERFTAVTSRVLDMLDGAGVAGTFFVVGELGAHNPQLVAEIAARGHEVGLHGWRHVALTELTADQLRQDVRRGRAALQDAAGTDVTGFRAPLFSLVPKTAWAIDVLGEEGFDYSSSVLPAASPLFGDPTAPREPFRWPNGLVELPCPIAGRGRFAVPFIGGIYLRYLPFALVLRLARSAPQGSWLYCHPYDFDPGAPFTSMPHAGRLTNRLLHHRRSDTLRRVSVLMERHGPGRPLRDVARDVTATT